MRINLFSSARPWDAQSTPERNDNVPEVLDESARRRQHQELEKEVEFLLHLGRGHAGDPPEVDEGLFDWEFPVKGDFLQIRILVNVSGGTGGGGGE